MSECEITLNSILGFGHALRVKRWTAALRMSCGWVYSKLRADSSFLNLPSYLSLNPLIPKGSGTLNKVLDRGQSTQESSGTRQAQLASAHYPASPIHIWHLASAQDNWGRRKKCDHH